MGRRSKRKKILLRKRRLLGIELDPQEARRVGLGYIIDEQERVKAEAEAKRLAEEKAKLEAEEEAAKKAAEAKKKTTATKKKTKTVAKTKRKKPSKESDSSD